MMKEVKLKLISYCTYLLCIYIYYSASSSRLVFSFQIPIHNYDYNCFSTNKRKSNSRLLSMSMSMSSSSSDSESSSDSASASISAAAAADPKDEWGITYYKENAYNTEAKCPTEPIQVVNDAFDAIAGTLYNKQRLDPAIAHNARSNSLYTHRPTRSSSDAGRIGVEIDGAEFLFASSSSENIPTTTSTNKRTRTRIGPNSSQRRISLILAAKLSSNYSWREYEKNNNDNKKSKSVSSSYRPVVLSFNTIKEALLARREMQFLQNNCTKKREREAYNHIIIQTISDGIPKALHRKRKYSNSNNDDNYAVDATNGLLIVVQPTDFNQEFNPPVPSLNTINDLQTTIACAFIQQLPVIVLSPRFLSYGENENNNKKRNRSTNYYDDDDDDDEYKSIDNIHNQIYHNQNGFFQQASFYGGTEPPRGPAPFILRDL